MIRKLCGTGSNILEDCKAIFASHSESCEPVDWKAWDWKDHVNLFQFIINNISAYIQLLTGNLSVSRQRQTQPNEDMNGGMLIVFTTESLAIKYLEHFTYFLKVCW
jgi:hypothetical protein